MLLKEFINTGTERLLALYPREEARSMVLMLCVHRLGVTSYTHIIEPATEIPQGKLSMLQNDLERLAKAEPVQYVLGEASFCDHVFKVGPGVLIPRPETECLVSEVIRLSGRLLRSRAAYGSGAAKVRVLDLCTGSGCIAWSVALGIPGVEVTAVDISSSALAIACTQDLHGQAKKLRALPPSFLVADILQAPPESIAGKFDIIVSNPPYVMESQKSQMRPNVLDYEPEQALFVPDEDPMLFYRAIAQWSRSLLAEGGSGLVEINDLLGEMTACLFREEGFQHTSVIRDFSEKNRIVRFSRMPF